VADFRIVSGFSPTEVQHKINDLLALGFELRGQLMLTVEPFHEMGSVATKYTQALVRNKGEKKEGSDG